MQEKKLPANLFSGLSGLQLPVPKYLFPKEHQESSRLTYYATFFNSIEINSTFYKLPLASTLSKWLQQVPDDFRFTFKLWQEISHTKELDFKETDVERFFAVIAAASLKKGAVLVQFPPSLSRFYIQQLSRLLSVIDRYNAVGWTIAVEFRNKTWYEKEVYALLDKHKAALVVQDIPKSASPMVTDISDAIYLRFHGPTGNYRESYPDYHLSEYAAYVKEWLNEGKTVYVYFNNTMGDAFKNLELMNLYCCTP